MNISNSKKQLAEIIHENGGWRDRAQFSAQDKDGEVFHYATKPTIGAGREVWDWRGCIGEGEFMAKPLPNWHQTILSRDEYFHLYPVPDADVGSLSAALDLVTDENKHEHVDSKPSIEQLAADCRNAKDYAERKQEEADAAKADAEAKLVELVAAGKAHGLVLSVAEPEQEKPAKPYTGKFYNDGTDKRNFQTLCDGCGKRYGLHYGDRCKSGSEG